MLTSLVDRLVFLSWTPARHHGQFHRMLVAQALVEGLTLVTRDEKIARNEVAVLRIP
ncbi:MAG: hypothetical protein IT186_20425 [Acidobacteria bacterium]|nr:hypothetical protein [Acidobacteriota bacterium]